MISLDCGWYHLEYLGSERRPFVWSCNSSDISLEQNNFKFIKLSIWNNSYQNKNLLISIRKNNHFELFQKIELLAKSTNEPIVPVHLINKIRLTVEDSTTKEDTRRLGFMLMSIDVVDENKLTIENIPIENTLIDIRKKLLENQDAYKNHKGSIVLVNHVSNPYGATHYLLNLFKLLKNKGIKVCLLDEIVNEKLYSKYQIDTKDVISYEQDLTLLCYIYEKIKPKIFYLNSIRDIFVDFIKLKNPNVVTHSHEIADVYGRYDLLPTYVVSKRIQKEFEDKYNHKPEIQPPIFLKEALELIDEEFSKELPKVSNHNGDIDLSKITIGMCGQTEPRKNPSLFAEISKLYPEYNFLWVGGEEGYFAKIDNLYHVPVVQLPYVYYKLMDYFVLFSKEDPCPYVVLENLYVNNKVITFKDNIYTDHKSEHTQDIYFEFDGEVSIKNLCKVINGRVIEKTNRIGNGKKYIMDNFTKINLCSAIQESNSKEDIDYFIVCHDQDIIIDALQKNKFSGLPNYKFMFVGHKPTNLIENTENVIICNKLEFNIEQYPKLCSFTAWYAVSKNGLSKKKYCCLLEYDVELSQDFHEKNLEAISKAGVCSYFIELIDNPVFSDATPWLNVFFKKYNINTPKIYKEKFWHCTTNFIVRNDILENFNNWFYEIASMFKDCDLGAYMHERMINIYCILNEINIEYIKNKLKHFQMCSHQKEDLFMIAKKSNLDLNVVLKSYEDNISKH
jgi:hypothetical protein